MSAVRLLTTPEIAAALEASRGLEESLGLNHYRRWLLLGEGASAEALDLIRREGIYCSNREQFTLLQEMLTPQPSRVAQPKVMPLRKPRRRPQATKQNPHANQSINQ